MIHDQIKPFAVVVEEAFTLDEEAVEREMTAAEGVVEPPDDGLLIPVTIEYDFGDDLIDTFTEETSGVQAEASAGASLGAGTASVEIVLAKVTTTEYGGKIVRECWKALGRKYCHNVLAGVKRTCKKQLIGGFEYPTDIPATTLKIAKRCAREAAIEAGVLSIIMENPASFFATFATLFKACMRAHFTAAVIKKFRPLLFTKSSCGSWKRT